MRPSFLGRVHVAVNVHLQTAPANNTRGMTVSKHNANETGANYAIHKRAFEGLIKV